MQAATFHYVVMAGTKCVACYMAKDAADELKDFLGSAGANAVSTIAVVPGVDGDPTQTCDNYLKGADAIVSETVAILNAT